MHLKQQGKIIFTITLFYSLFILYFMFLAFGRAGTVEHSTEYTFLFLPDSFFRLPDLSDLLHPTVMDLVGFGNIAAFIPYGILIPMLYRTGFIRFMTWFILSILVLETLQALTLLGSFDMNDVIQNSLGAAVGFGANKIGFRSKNIWRNIAAAGISIVILMIGVWGAFGLVDQALTKEEGPFVAVNELRDSAGNSSAATRPYSLNIGGEVVEPQFNIYSAGGTSKKTYTYALDNKEEMYLSLNYGIPDQEELSGSVRVSIDGNEFLSVSSGYLLHETGMSEVFLPQSASEVTIVIEGNMIIWDVGYKEMKYFWN